MEGRHEHLVWTAWLYKGGVAMDFTLVIVFNSKKNLKILG